MSSANYVSISRDVDDEHSLERYIIVHWDLPVKVRYHPFPNFRGFWHTCGVLEPEGKTSPPRGPFCGSRT